MQDENFVTSAGSALDSLDRLAAELETGKAEEALAWKGILAWGWHAVVLLAYMRMQPNRDSFDAWLWDYLGEGEAKLDVERDAHWEERQRLSLLEILDIFSQVELPLLKPEFYQGWTDRTVRCHTLRRQILEIVGSGIGDEQRQGLLILLAAYHRLVRFPAAVALDSALLSAHLVHLFGFIEALIDPEGARSAELLEALGRCREAV